MNIDFSKKAEQPNNLIMQKISDGEYIILNTTNENYYGLDKVGSDFYELLTGSDSIDSAIKKILKNYDVMPDNLIHDIKAFVNELLRYKLIELG